MSNTITTQTNSPTELSPEPSSVENKQQPPITVPVLGGFFGTITFDSEGKDRYCSGTQVTQNCQTKRSRIGTYCSCPPSEAEFRDLMNSILKKGTWEEKSSDDALAVQGK